MGDKIICAAIWQNDINTLCAVRNIYLNINTDSIIELGARYLPEFVLT